MLRERTIDDAGARPKLRRNEKHIVTRRRLFAAAIKVVGKHGYAGASVARITEEAGVAQGTFYLHFENRQTLLDQLLPVVGEAVSHAVRERDHSAFTEDQREVERCRAFFSVLKEMPEYFRIQNEAELFAREGYARHMDGTVAAYIKALRRGLDSKDPDPYTDDELEVVAHILLGARACMGKRYGADSNVPVPGYVFSAYAKLMRRGLSPAGT